MQPAEEIAQLSGSSLANVGVIIEQHYPALLILP